MPDHGSSGASSGNEQPPPYEGHVPDPLSFLDPESRGLHESIERAQAQPPAYEGTPNPLTFLDPESRQRQAEIERGQINPMTQDAPARSRTDQPPAYAGAPNPLAFLDAGSRQRQAQVEAGQVGQVAVSNWQIPAETQALIAQHSRSRPAGTPQSPESSRQRDAQAGSSSKARSGQRSHRSAGRRK